VVQSIKEADVFTGMSNLASNAFERPRRAGEIGAVIDYRDLTGGRSRILDFLLRRDASRYSTPRNITNRAVVH
jgi:hypothetical protein